MTLAGYLSVLWGSPSSLALALITFLGSCMILNFAGLLRFAKSQNDHEAKSIGWRALPQPFIFPVLKNLPLISLKEPLRGVQEIGTQYRDAFRFELPSMSFVIINSYRLYDEICSSKRFHKEPVGAMLEARNLGGVGLFTDFTHEQTWQVAHRVIGPELGQVNVQKTAAEMSTLTKSLVQLWTDRRGTTFDPFNDLTNYSLDCISQCAFNLQLGALDSREDMHHFAHLFTHFLTESGQRAVRPAFATKYLYPARDKAYRDCFAELRELGATTVAKRRLEEEQNVKEGIAPDHARKDILHHMLHTPDPITGLKMTDEQCYRNVLALLGAGFEAVASVLFWTLITLIRHPACLSKVRDELKTMAGHDGELSAELLTPENLKRLPYLLACIRETMRLYPPAFTHAVVLRGDINLENDNGLGKEGFQVSRKDIIRLNLFAIQRDPDVWGEDADEFKPERMLEERFQKLPRNSWKPFGTGERICVGRYFGLQQAHIVLAILLSTFEFALVDDDKCKLIVGSTVILRPTQCAMRATRRC